MVTDENAPESQPNSVHQLDSTLAPSMSFLLLIKLRQNVACYGHPHKFAKEPKNSELLRTELNMPSTFMLSPQITSSPYPDVVRVLSPPSTCSNELKCVHSSEY